MIPPLDPARIDEFKAAIRRIPGYPAGEDVPIKEMVFESDAVFRLPQLLMLAGASLERQLFVVMDHTLMRRGEKDLKPFIDGILRTAGWHPEPVWLEPDASGQVHTDLPQIEHVRRRLVPGAAVLSVGSGVVTDVAKHACYLFEKEAHNSLPLISFQTANSVSAFTSNMAPVFVDHVKRTLPSRYPDVLVCDLETLRDAPREMTQAGVGDLLAALTSFGDWYLASRLGMDATYTEFAQTLMGPLEETLSACAPAIRAGTLEGAAVLAKLIALAGVAMSLSHATTPLSGFEHTVSHLIDLLAEAAGRPVARHGIQVALSAILSSETYRILLSDLEPARVSMDACFPSPEEMERRIRSRFAGLDESGRIGAECWSDYRQKLEKWHDQRVTLKNFLDEWPVVCNKLRDLVRPPEVILETLREVGSPLTFDALTPPVNTEDVQFAYLNAAFIRRRLTVGDLPVFLNWDQQALWSRVWAKSRALTSNV